MTIGTLFGIKFVGRHAKHVVALNADLVKPVGLGIGRSDRCWRAVENGFGGVAHAESLTREGAPEDWLHPGGGMAAS